jgi:hypothetical protein
VGPSCTHACGERGPSCSRSASRLRSGRTRCPSISAAWSQCEGRIRSRSRSRSRRTHMNGRRPHRRCAQTRRLCWVGCPGSAAGRGADRPRYGRTKCRALATLSSWPQLAASVARLQVAAAKVQAARSPALSTDALSRAPCGALCRRRSAARRRIGLSRRRRTPGSRRRRRTGRRSCSGGGTRRSGSRRTG